MIYKLPMLLVSLILVASVGGCVSRPETAPVPPAAVTVPDRTTINAPTVVNQPPPAAGPQMTFQVAKDPNNPSRGWVLVGNQPVEVKFEGGVWVFDTGSSGQSTSSPSPPPPPAPSQPSQGRNGTNGSPVSLPTTPPGYMSPAVAEELLFIDRIELYRTLLARMKILAANAQVNSVDEFNVMISRLESILREMERLQHNAQQPQPPQQQTSPQP